MTTLLSRFLALTTVGAGPLRGGEPASKGIVFAHCDGSSRRKCENGAAELATPQKKNTSSENNGVNGRACDPARERRARVQTERGRGQKGKHRDLLEYA